MLGLTLRSMLLLSSLTAAAPLTQATAPQVTLDYATYQGSTAGGITHFYGMSYAAPPLRDLRFRAPQAPIKAAGVQDATEFKDVCIGVGQNPGVSAIGGYTFGEDCLYISVTAPAGASNTSMLPVLAYITGGGFAAESSTNFDFDQTVLKSGGSMIVVQFNYRLGALGFLAGQEVAADGNLNVGLLDQRQALQWINTYISHFGGNPDHVVIVGGSAGAGSVGLQVSAYGGKDDGLFVGAIGDATFYPNVNNASLQELQFARLSEAVGCAAATNRLACLRATNISTLQNGNVATAYPGHDMASKFSWTPVVDGDFVQDLPLRLYQAGKFVKVPLIIGDVTDEGTLFAYNAASPKDVGDFMSANYPYLSQQDLATMNTLYPLTAPLPLHNAYFPSAAAAYGEATFKCPGLLIAESMVNANQNVWSYHFNQGVPALEAAGFGVAHNTDLGAIFGPNVGPSTGFFDVEDDIEDSILFGAFSGSDAPVVPIMMDYIISFTRSLNPNTYKSASAPVWNQIGTSGSLERVLVQNVGSQMEAIPNDFQSRCAFWNSFISLTA